MFRAFLLPVLVGFVAIDQQVSGGGLEDARHHLDRRGLAGTVRADVADDLAWFDVERDSVDCLDDSIVGRE
jgi:hypothetical protein